MEVKSHSMAWSVRILSSDRRARPQVRTPSHDSQAFTRVPRADPRGVMWSVNARLIAVIVAGVLREIWARTAVRVVKG